MTELVTYVKHNGTKIRINPNQPLINELIQREGWKNWDELERERLKAELKAEMEAEEAKKEAMRAEIKAEMSKSPEGWEDVEEVSQKMDEADQKSTKRKRRTKEEMEADAQAENNV